MEDLAKNTTKTIPGGGGLGGVAPPARAARNMRGQEHDENHARNGESGGRRPPSKEDQLKTYPK